MSFYLQSWKLIFAVYHIVTDPKTNTSKFNRYQAEAVIPWVNDVVLYLTIALQTAQQLKDKVCIIYFQYIDLYIYILTHIFLLGMLTYQHLHLLDQCIFAIPGLYTKLWIGLEVYATR